MTLSRRSLILLLPFAPLVHAMVIRDGVPDSSYVVPGNAFSPLADLPGEGHGTLIASRWVVTAAHAIIGHHPESVTIDGKLRAVTESILHPDFKTVPTPEMSGDAGPMVKAFRQMHDIALLRLAAPIDDVKPVELYLRTDEKGKLVTLYGKGASGNGVTGEYANSPHRGLLRRARNRISGAENQWLTYVFDCGLNAPALEGVIGGGDSGGPVLVEVGGVQKLAAVSSWKAWRGDLKDFRSGVCGYLELQDIIVGELPQCAAKKSTGCDVVLVDRYN